MEPYIITRIGLDDYPKCGAIWDMDACPYTQTFISQIKAGNRDNAPAVGLYKSLGFTIYEEAEDKDGKFCRMEKKL